MAALASAPPWIPEDDLLLKNAVEAGASLEALAKGAVRFSRRFTVRELQDRWHSLLYDPIISAEASAHMIDSEVSAKKYGNCSNSSEDTKKRKYESVRKLYHAMRKRICGEINSYFVDHDVIGENNTNGCLRNDCMNGLSERVQVLSRKQLVKSDGKSFFPQKEGTEFGDCPGALEMGPSHGLPSCGASYDEMGLSCSPARLAFWKNLDEIPAPEMSLNVRLEEKDQVVEKAMLHPDDMDGVKANSSTYDPQNMDKILPDKHAGDRVNLSGAVSENDFVDISDCLLNLADEEDLVSNDVDVKDTLNEQEHATDAGYHPGCNSKILACPDEKLEDSVVVPGDSHSIDHNTCHANQGDTSAEKSDAVTELSELGHSDHRPAVSIQADVQSIVADPNSLSSIDVQNEFLICTLNTEDPEIPYNNEFPSSPEIFASHQTNSRSIGVVFYSSDKGMEQNQNVLKREENPLEASTGHRMTDPPLQPDRNPNYHLVSCGTKTDVSDAQCVGVLLKDVSSSAGTIPCRLVAGAPNSAKNCALESISVDASHTKSFSTEAEEISAGFTLGLDKGSSGVDQEENESESLVPSFGDIEAMILDMDLCPNDWDSTTSREVSRYQKEDTRRAIIRMEQCARSSIKRTIGSRGALAILYGRQSKHYIKKTEVILGRSTNDFKVDIDLGTEGGSNQISRRQALIKLERDASFSLKNLGKSSMFLNGKEVSSGKCVQLISSCLVEVKGIAFVFEMNERSVQRHLAKLTKGSQKGNSSFEWSPEGVP